jgi:predicted nucleic-acid-binding Zn-ribbon protein
MSEVKKCPKCGSTNVSKKDVRLPDPTFAAIGSLTAIAYVCNSCGYIELYRK